MHIGFKDLVWNYAAVFLKIAGSVLLLPFILHKMSSETVGIWTIFMTITSLATLLDFGFNPAFARNVTYVFSGAKELKKTGYNNVTKGEESIIDYDLLKGVISAMRWFYSRISILLFLLLISFGTYYINTILKSYNGNHIEVYISWFVLCLICTYNLYTLYFESLLLGKGMVKISKQIIITGQLTYLTTAVVLILLGQGLIAIVSAQALSVIIIRSLSYRSFFTPSIKQKLNYAKSYNHDEVLKAIYPNAIKVGLTALGGFVVSRASIFIGSLYLSLQQIASYGITMQLIYVISALASIYTFTFAPKIAQHRIQGNNLLAIKKIYLKGQIILFITYLTGGLGLIIIGNFLLFIIGSKTQLMHYTLIALQVFITFLERNHDISASIIIQSKNEVPFFKASLCSGGMTILLLVFFLNFTNLGLWSLLLSPGIAQVLYQNWKWPLTVIRELNIKLSDYKLAYKTIFKF